MWPRQTQTNLIGTTVLRVPLIFRMRLFGGLEGVAKSIRPLAAIFRVDQRDALNNAMLLSVVSN